MGGVIVSYCVSNLSAWFFTDKIFQSYLCRKCYQHAICRIPLRHTKGYLHIQSGFLLSVQSPKYLIIVAFSDLTIRRMVFIDQLVFLCFFVCVFFLFSFWKANCSEIDKAMVNFSYFYRLQTKLREGNVLHLLSVCSQDGGDGFPTCITGHITSLRRFCLQGEGICIRGEGGVWQTTPQTGTRKAGGMHPTRGWQPLLGVHLLPNVFVLSNFFMGKIGQIIGWRPFRGCLPPRNLGSATEAPRGNKNNWQKYIGPDVNNSDYWCEMFSFVCEYYLCFI